MIFDRLTTTETSRLLFAASIVMAGLMLPLAIKIMGLSPYDTFSDILFWGGSVFFYGYLFYIWKLKK